MWRADQMKWMQSVRLNCVHIYVSDGVSSPTPQRVLILFQLYGQLFKPRDSAPQEGMYTFAHTIGINMFMW